MATTAPVAAREPEYILGTDQQESARLRLQHRLWSAAAHVAWERARIRPGMCVLDVGCGPGHAALELAEIVGSSGRVIGIDESPAFLKQLHDQAVARRLTNVDRILGDVQDLGRDPAKLGVPASSIDFAYARWVLCFVPDPAAVISGVARAMRPGARLVIQDYFNYESMTIAPKNEAFSRVIRAVGASWRSRGGDPDVVGRIPAMLASVGLELEHLGVHQRVARPGETMWEWPDSFWRSFVPRLVEAGFLTEGDRRDFETCWSQASRDRSSFMSLPPVFDVIAVRR